MGIIHSHYEYISLQVSPKFLTRPLVYQMLLVVLYSPSAQQCLVEYTHRYFHSLSGSHGHPTLQKGPVYYSPPTMWMERDAILQWMVWWRERAICSVHRHEIGLVPQGFLEFLFLLQLLQVNVIHLCVFVCVIHSYHWGKKLNIYFLWRTVGIWGSNQCASQQYVRCVCSIFNYSFANSPSVNSSFLSSCSCVLYSSHFFWWCNHHPLELYTHWGAGAHTSFCDCLHGHTCQHSTGCSQWKPDWPLSDVPWHSHLHSRVPIHLPSHCLQSVWQ